MLVKIYSIHECVMCILSDRIEDMRTHYKKSRHSLNENFPHKNEERKTKITNRFSLS